MRNRSFFRVIMIVVGILATIAIVLSQALPEQAPEKAQTEQTDQDKDVKILPAPSDVVPGGIVQVNDADRSLLEIFVNEEPKILEFECDDHILSAYLIVLFRAIISPNAP
ncbi:MAG: hypothetical protein KDC93_05365 [Cyclobacteriaceae bacterium]|nr:hypothetical protein [Cyclobacteriaceae bacterium]